MSAEPVVFFAGPEDPAGAVGPMLERSGFFGRVRRRKTVGLKVHFGEEGNTTHLDPAIVRAASIALSFHDLQPVVIETTALYRGRRQTAAGHLELAREHGFGPARTLAPLLILDGEEGERSYDEPLNSELVPVARLAHGLRRIRHLVNLAHFKGHFVTGFGGVVKNLAMGLSAKAGKLEMHSNSKPAVDADRCVSCGKCVDYCPVAAIGFDRYVAHIGPKCTGCGGCLAVCPQEAIRVKWNAASESVQRKMVEYCRAVLRGRAAFHFNFAVNITRNCDCDNHAQEPVMPDVGVFGSLDPVACEQAAWDRTEANLKAIYPKLDPGVLLDAAEAAGLGSRRYRLEEL
ncbi:DUF362 domain-containing protein [candidate division WOR-3 bacterium]|nr:DUF362 domain-containing protein [candidate division WOR-3 bacterium]